MSEIEDIKGEWDDHGDTKGSDVVSAITEALGAGCIYPTEKIPAGKKKTIHQSEFEYEGEGRLDGSRVKISTVIYVELVP